WVRGSGLGPLMSVRAPTTVTTLPTEHPRVMLLCLDGSSLDIISPAVAAGRLPNFGRLLDGGASMHLATTRPTQPEPVWASMVTGLWASPARVRGSARSRPFNGEVAVDVLPDYLFSQALIRLGLLIEEPYSSASLQSLPLWQIAERYGVPTGMIGLPLTHPADSRAGFIVSDRFHRRGDRSAVLDAQAAISPARIDEGVTAAISGGHGR